LALEAGFAVSASFPDGCWMVELAPVSVETAVPFAFAAGLDVTAARDGDVIEDLVRRLRHKRLLIIVDNCEHVLAAAADVVERVVIACPAVTVLATSREPLMVRGERLVPVSSLTPADAEWLFLERARDEAPDLVIDADQARAVAELCLRLDGLPLALELAASRARALTPVELVANLEARFRLLVGGRRARIERHQTMRGTLDWSYHLCGEVERTVFDRLSVFPAGFDLVAARAVASGDGVGVFDVVDVVAQLHDRSLLQRSTAPDGTTRHRMLETMREYGREHLEQQGASDATRERHARYIASTIGALSLHTIGPDERVVWQRLNDYLLDAIVALDWCIEHQEWENGLRIASVGTQLSERESGEMSARLYDAANAAGVVGDLLDEMERRDPRAEASSDDLQAERGWRTIRGEAPIPTDRFAFPPHGDFGVGVLDAADVDEFLASLDRWSSTPPINRYAAERHALRALALSGHLERIEEPLRGFSKFVGELHSELASRELAELHAVIAVAGHDWADAARWYGQAHASDGVLRTWFDLNVAWGLLMARALCAGPFELTGADLRDPWRCYRDEHLDVLRWRGATSTAVALHRAGLDELAGRLVAWAELHDPTGAESRLFGDALKIADLPTTGIDQPGDLETLINELFALADELDGLSI
jgi:predicted ATPase